MEELNTEADGEVLIKSREEIIQNRRERRKQKKEVQKVVKEQELLRQKLNKQSGKLQIIDSATLEEQQKERRSVRLSKSIKNKIEHGNAPTGAFNLLDFLTERREQNQISNVARHKFKNNKLTINRFRGKRRDTPRKRHFTRIKKLILQNREKKKDDVLNNGSNEVENVANQFQNLELVPKEKFVHSRKFRSYCDNTTSPQLCQQTENLLRELFRFQKRAYEKNEIKGRAYRRFVVGLKEAQTQLSINKIKLLVIAPDCENCDIEGGLDEVIQNLKNECNKNSVPYVFSLPRRKLGYVLYKKVPVSCVSILNYDGAQDIFKELVNTLNTERIRYENNFKPGV